MTEGEAGWLRPLGFKNVSVIGHVREPALGPRDFADRSGLLFVGAIHEYDSPNYDSICWFIDLVLPFIEAELGYETSLTIVGYTADGITFERFSDHPRVSFRGQVIDTEPYYHAHRVFVAPTRFAAGAPFKLYEAASFGLPIVSTELLRGQMGWTNERDILWPTSPTRAASRTTWSTFTVMRNCGTAYETMPPRGWPMRTQRRTIPER